MSIKTSELQQLQSILGTDSLLADTAAAGTGRVSAAALAQFMDQELLKPGTALSTALSNKAALSVQQTVERTTVTYRKVTVAAAELQGYLEAMPRLLTELLEVTVRQGIVPSDLKLDGFYGPGALSINGNDSTLSGGILIDRCSVYVNLSHFDARGAVAASGRPTVVYVGMSKNVILSQITIDGAQNSVDRTRMVGVRCDNCGMACMIGCQISNVDIALMVTGAHVVSARDCSGSGNQIGVETFVGGIALLVGSTPDLLGGATNAKYGGLTVKSDGTLL